MLFQGYVPHLVSTFGEWTMAFAFLLYFSTYIFDFQKMTVELKTSVSVQQLIEVPTNHEPNERTRLVV